MPGGGRELLQATKAAASYPQPAMSVPFGRPMMGALRPVVTRPGAIPADDIRRLTEWRNSIDGNVFTSFKATEERTERWLAESIGPDDTRILFMVDDAEGRTVGFVGLAFIVWEGRCAELDNFIRGEDAPPGLMTEARRTLWRWGVEALGLEKLLARPRSDNTIVDYFLRKAGGVELMRVPLREKKTEDGGTELVEDPSLEDSDPTVVYMELEVND